MSTMQHDPRLDLVFERTASAPPELLWKAWTQPEHIKRWFTPAPWQTTECEIELRPGGLFYTRMRGPDGEDVPNKACYLEVVENRKLVWTDALERDYRPAALPNDCFNHFFTATLLFEPIEGGTRYIAIARHASEDARKSHEEQGFEDGWGAAYEQMLELIKKEMM
ncbi:SRPBCC family protein [Gilvimarinus sp. F26214L]|uniref:SRPBCC family protein n=1 Tax=Gilvimarinus sp. DZF01 TaxID=3461371 RepID=UPI0040453659